MASQSIATVVLVFRGHHFTSAELGHCPGVAITNATRVVMTAVKNKFLKTEMNHQGNAAIRVEVDSRQLEGSGTGDRPGMAITAATDDVMRKVRELPKEKRSRPSRFDLERSALLPAP